METESSFGGLLDNSSSQETEQRHGKLVSLEIEVQGVRVDCQAPKNIGLRDIRV
jgi:hypothetical protein